MSFWQKLKSFIKRKKTVVAPETAKQTVNLYKSLDEMPLYNWEQLSLTGNNEFLINLDEIKQSLIPDLLKLWRLRKAKDFFSDQDFEDGYFVLYDQFLGLSEDLFDNMKQWRILIELRMDARLAYAKGDEFQINWINHYTELIKAHMNSGSNTSIRKNRIIIQKLHGMPLNPKKMSVADFMEISELEREINKNTKKDTDASAD